MTNEELREIHVPEGCHLVTVYDDLDNDGPLIKVYERDKTPEEAARVRAKIQQVINEVYTANCLRAAMAEEGK